MVPYGDKSNYNSVFNYPIKISEGKYALGKFQANNGSISGANNMIYSNSIENIIGNTIFKNLVGYAPMNTNKIGILAQNYTWKRYSSQGSNGYGMLFQDNYEDKPEIRCYYYAYCMLSNSYSTYDRQRYYIDQRNVFNKNGNCSPTEYIESNPINKITLNAFITYKTTTNGQYYGMWPVFSI